MPMCCSALSNDQLEMDHSSICFAREDIVGGARWERWGVHEPVTRTISVDHDGRSYQIYVRDWMVGEIEMLVSSGLGDGCERLTVKPSGSWEWALSRGKRAICRSWYR